MDEDSCTNIGYDLCAWVPCDRVGYCDAAKEDERRRMIDSDYSHSPPPPTKMTSGWGTGSPPTPRPTKATYLRTPKPTKEPKTTTTKTPRPTMMKTKTPKPTKIKTTKTPKPTVWKAPKTTKIKTTKVKTTKYKEPKTPKPTVWRAPKTPKPTVWKAPKTTKEPRTPRPTATYLRTTRATYMQPNPVSGCGAYLTKGECPAECVWRSGYPPLEFDAESELLNEEFAVLNGPATELLNNSEFQMFFGIGLLIAAVLLLAYRQYSLKKEKSLVASSETTPLVETVVNYS